MLKDKVTFVTGASSGVGRAVALIRACKGAKAVVPDIDEKKGGREEAAVSVRAQEADAVFLAADAGKPEDSKKRVQRAVARLGRLDVACNNGGTGSPGALTADCPLDGGAEALQTGRWRLSAVLNT